jgi:hypothetical protein
VGTGARITPAPPLSSICYELLASLTLFAMKSKMANDEEERWSGTEKD